MEVLIILLYLIFGILSLILFFKVWGMTNDVAQILKLLQERDIPVKTPSQNDKPISNKHLEIDSEIFIGDIVRLNINNKRFRVAGNDNGRYICEDILGLENTTYKFRKDEIKKYKADQE